MLKYILALLVLITFPLAAENINSVSQEITHIMPDAMLAGKGRLSFLTWDVYDAFLYAPKGKYVQGKPIALSLHYLCDIKGKEIAEKTIEEMRSQGFKDEVTLAAWHEKMRHIFPNVAVDTRLTGIYTAKGETLFFKDGMQIGSFQDPEFGRYFFNIWLGNKSIHPELRRQLLGIR